MGLGFPVAWDLGFRVFTKLVSKFVGGSYSKDDSPKCLGLRV